ncbi:MAG: hypothetical protein KatS3mg015_2629 [Fimbriimonadales bacterium]|nr:MAG: hypothetical protein KatS3mg015_2629 [Fimbriimonadales bacterium]
MTDENDKLDVAAGVGDGKGDNTLVDRGDEVKSPLDKAGKEGVAEGDKLDLLDEGDETPEEKAEHERLEAEEAKKRNIRIPKSRFDEAQAKARAREQALLEEIERLKSGQQASATQKAVSDMRAKIEELQDKYEDLILDGRKEEARKIRKQVEAMREELVEYQTSVKSDAARKAAIEELTYNAQLANLEAKYPAINPEHEDFDEDKTNEVAMLLNAFVKSGIKRADALAKAVKYVLGSPPEQKVSDAAKALAEERARKAREKAAEAHSKQPPSMAKVGLDSDKAGKGGELGIDVMRMSQEKFAKLDEETKAKLRGDEL